MLPNRPPIPPGDVLLAGGPGGGRPAAPGRTPSMTPATSAAAAGSITAPSPAPPSAGETACRLLVRRRLLFATLLPPALYLLSPPTLALSYLLLGKVSGDRQVVSILGGLALTAYVRDGVVRYAPTVEKRDEALARCRVRLPLLSALGVGLVCRWLLEPLLGRILPGSGSEDHDGGGGDGKQQLALLTWAFWVGWYLCLTGLALGASVYFRFVGPVAIVRCSSVPLFTNPYEASACSAWSNIQSVFSSFDAFCDFVSEIAGGGKTDDGGGGVVRGDGGVSSSSSWSSSSSSIYRDDRRGHPPVLARPRDRPTTSAAAEADVVNPYVDSRRRSAAAPLPRNVSHPSRLSGSGRYKRPTLVRSLAQIVVHALCGAMSGAFLVSFFSEALFRGGGGSSWSSPPVVGGGGDGLSVEWWWSLLIAVVVSGSIACLSVMVHVLTSGDAGGAEWVTDPRRRPFTTELDVEMYPHLNDDDSDDSAGSSSLFSPSRFRALAGGEMRRCVRSTLTWTVCAVLLASPILVARIGHAASGGAAAYSLLHVAGLLRGLWTWTWMVLAMASTSALAICHLSLTDVLARLCLSQPVRLDVLARETCWSSSLPPSSACTSGEVLLDAVLGSPDLVRLVCAPTMALALAGVGVGVGGPAGFEGDESRRNVVASASVADRLLASIPSASGSVLEYDLGGALVLEALGGEEEGRDNESSADSFFGLPRHVAEVERRVRSRLAVPIARALSAHAGGIGECLHRTADANEERRRWAPVPGRQSFPDDDGLLLPPGAAAQAEWSIRAAARMVLAGLKRGGRHCPLALLMPSVMDSAYRLRLGCVRYATSRVESVRERGAALAVTKQQQHQLAVGNASRIMRASGGARNRFWIKNEMDHLGEPVMMFSPEIFPVIAACDEAAFLISEVMSAMDGRFQFRLDPPCREWAHHLATQK